MSESKKTGSTRRDFLKQGSTLVAASALAGMAVPKVHAGEDNTIRLALIGCGGRGTGAARDAMATHDGNVKLVAMADLTEPKIRESLETLQLEEVCADKIDVPKERQFLGFDAYKSAMDCLRPGDVVIMATPLVFRWVHFTYAIEKGLNVFMEKPLTADGPTSRRMLALGKAAQAKNLKVAVGLNSRHARHLQQLKKQIEDGTLGDISVMRAYRMTPPVGFAYVDRWPGAPEWPSELLWQMKWFHAFIWASGGCFNDFYIHVIDHCCWLKGAWPVEAQALGGRHYKLAPNGKPCIDQNFDVYAVEYTFADGARLFLDGRCIPGTEQIYSSYLHGTKGFAVASRQGDCGGPSSIHKGQKVDGDAMVWESKTPKGEENPYQNEWNDLIDAIRNDKPYSEVEYGVYASLTSSLGRKAAHTGVKITLQDLLKSSDEYAPNVDKLTLDSPSPLPCDSEGKYPIPQPGLVTNREY